MAILEAVLGGAAKATVSVVLNRLATAPAIALSYGKSGNDDLVRMIDLPLAHHRRISRGQEK